MKLESSQTWQRLVASRLIAPSQLAGLGTRIQTENVDLESPSALFEWLQQVRVISPFQAKILESGENGPFVFGEYSVSSQIDDGPLAGQYASFHRPTGHPVLLEFFDSGEAGLGTELWPQIESICRDASKAQSPFLVPTYEAVALAEYAFVVSERPNGALLAEKVPRKARLPWKAAINLVAQLATGLQTLHERGVSHGSLSPRAIWVEGKLRPKIKLPFTEDIKFRALDAATNESIHDYQAPEVFFGEPPQPASDIYSLGCLLARLISGRGVAGGETTEEKLEFLKQPSCPNLGRYELPAEIETLASSMIQRDIGGRPSSVKEVLEVFRRQTRLDVEPSESDSSETDSRARFQRHLAANAAFFASPLSIEPVNITPDESPKLSNKPKSEAPIADVAEYQRQIREQRKRSQWARGLTLVLGSVAMFGLVLFLVSRLTFERPQWSGDGSDVKTNATAQGGNVKEGEPRDEPLDRIEPPPPGTVLHQFVRADDGVMLWESPTTGPRLDFEWLPQNARLIFTVRLADVVQQPQGRLALDALAPELRQQIDAWLATLALQETDVKQAIIALYPLDDAFYSPLSIISLANEVPLQRLKELWNAVADESDAKILRAGEVSFFPLKSPRDEGKVTGFVVGPHTLVQQSLEFQGLSSLDGSLRSLARRVDSSRHFNALVLPSAMFNQQGQALVGEVWGPVLRTARNLTPTEIKGLLFSLHFEGQQCYWELTMDHAIDSKPPAMITAINSVMAEARWLVDLAAADLPVDPYWDRVRVRLNNIVDGWIRTSRFGGEAGLVIVNNWVPDSAVHNLLKASDLALRLGSAAPLEVITTRPRVPQTLEELLQTKRDLSVTTNPDLNILLKNLETEVNETYSDLPFSFQIEIAGNSLLLEGITQNQRPGDFELINKSLEQILTEIVFRANPDKEAASPADPKCKLVWLLQESADAPNQSVILITTRAGAQEAGLKLPQPFVGQK